jgi:uncharacterized membrane protein YfcA
MIDHLWLFVLLALLSEILGTVGGFGSSLLFVPMASMFLDVHSVLGITALFHVTSNLSKIALFRNGFDKRLLLYLGIPSVILVIIGAELSNHIETEVLEKALGFFLIILSLFFLIKKDWRIQPSHTTQIIGGGLSGFLAGLLGTGGAIRGIVLSAYGLKMEVFIATSAIIDLGVDVSRSIIYSANGYVHKHDLYLLPILFVVSLLGTWIGKKMLGHISESVFRKIVLYLILAVGIFSLFQAF